MPSELELIDAAFARIGDHAFLGTARADKVFWLDRMRQAAVANADFYKHHLDDIFDAYDKRGISSIYAAIERYDRAQQRRRQSIQGGDETTEARPLGAYRAGGEGSIRRLADILAGTEQAQCHDQMLRSDLMLI